MRDLKARPVVSPPLSRRALLAGGVTVATAVLLRVEWAPAGSRPAYALAPESVLPADIRQAVPDVRAAYRFAVANRDVLRYIPCYCGCGAEGHTSNASCYVKDDSPPGQPVFDRMSLG